MGLPTSWRADARRRADAITITVTTVCTVTVTVTMIAVTTTITITIIQPRGPRGQPARAAGASEKINIR